jgi:hypothetical protein
MPLAMDEFIAFIANPSQEPRVGMQLSGVATLTETVLPALALLTPGTVCAELTADRRWDATMDAAVVFASQSERSAVGFTLQPEHVPSIALIHFPRGGNGRLSSSCTKRCQV